MKTSSAIPAIQCGLKLCTLITGKSVSKLMHPRCKLENNSISDNRGEEFLLTIEIKLKRNRKSKRQQAEEEDMRMTNTALYNKSKW